MKTPFMPSILVTVSIARSLEAGVRILQFIVRHTFFLAYQDACLVVGFKSIEGQLSRPPVAHFPPAELKISRTSFSRSQTMGALEVKRQKRTKDASRTTKICILRYYLCCAQVCRFRSQVMCMSHRGNHFRQTTSSLTGWKQASVVNCHLFDVAADVDDVAASLFDVTEQLSCHFSAS